MEDARETDSRQQDKAPSAAPEMKKKRVQYCTFCKNHNIQAHKKDHLCPFKQCNCSLCELQRRAQVSMRHQQRVWRHQKHKLSFGKFHDVTNVLMEKGQVCDKCRNHNKKVMKKNHQCPYNDCTCDYCSLTFKRRELMKHLQRVRRSKITIEKDAVPTPPQKNQEKESERDKPFIPEEPPLQNVHMETESPTTPSSGYPEEQSCSSWSDDWSSQSPDAPSLNGFKEDAYEERAMEPYSPSPMQSRTPGPPSPPPLIPLTQNYHIHHPHPSMSRSIVNLASQIEMSPQTDNCEKQNRSPPLLCPMQPEDNLIPLFQHQRVSQIQRAPSFRRHSLMEQDSREYYTVDTPSTSSSCITQLGSRSSDHQHYLRKTSVKFGVAPEDLYLRQSNWQSSSTESKMPDSGSPPPLLVPSGHQRYSDRSQESVYPCTAMEGKGMFYFYNTANHYTSPPNAYPQNLSLVKRIYQD